MVSLAMLGTILLAGRRRQRPEQIPVTVFPLGSASMQPFIPTELEHSDAPHVTRTRDKLLSSNRPDTTQPGDDYDERMDVYGMDGLRVYRFRSTNGRSQSDTHTGRTSSDRAVRRFPKLVGQDCRHRRRNGDGEDRMKKLPRHWSEPGEPSWTRCGKVQVQEYLVP